MHMCQIDVHKFGGSDHGSLGMLPGGEAAGEFLHRLHVLVFFEADQPPSVLTRVGLGQLRFDIFQYIERHFRAGSVVSMKNVMV